MSEPDATSGSIEAALEQAVSGNAATSQPATEPETPAAVTPTTEPAPAAEQTQSTDKGDRPGPVPYDRFHEKVEEVKDLNAKMVELEAKFNNAVEREDGLTSKVRDLESEASVLDQIRALAEDENWKPTLEKLDAKLRGIEEEVVEGDKTEAQGDRETAKAIQDVKGEIREAFEEQQTDLIVMQAREISDRYISQLPDEYTTAEKEVIAEMLTPRVDWDAIAESPKDLREHMAEGLKAALQQYGEPRGALEAKLSEVNQNTTSTTPVKSSEEREQELLNTDWAETVDGPEGATLLKHSNEDFAKALADRLKMG